MSELVARPISVYDLPLAVGAAILHPEQVVLNFGRAGTVDIGFLCYLRREPQTRTGKSVRKSGFGRKVVVDSFNAARAGRVRALIEHISQEFSESGRRPETVRNRASRFLPFMTWADTHGYIDVLEDEGQARLAVREYAMFIRDRVNQNLISLTSGAGQQAAAFSLLGDFLEIDDLTRGVNLLRGNQRSNEGTLPPCEDAQAKVLSMCEALFNSLTELVLDAKPYPFRVPMPKYLGWADPTLWIFPTSKWCMAPHEMEQRHKAKVPFLAYDYANGRLATMDELKLNKSFAGDNDITRRQVLRRCRLQIEAANADPQNINRRHMSALALNIFVLMFIAQTGMNWAQAVEMPWSGEYEAGVERQVFRAIKWRAGNRKVYFEIPVSFLPTFKRYLELRSYILDGISCEFLFFSLGCNTLELPKMLPGGPTPLFKILQRIDPQLPKIMPRQWRAAKSDWLIRNTDPSTAALVLQNAEKTVLKSYTAGSETVHLEEMTLFLDKVSAVVVENGKVIEGSINCAVGVCSSYGAPHQISGEIAVQPDCKEQEGCLFCDKFKVHADDQDTRKLLSCRYCLQQSAHLAGSEERIQSMLGPIFDRIQVILDEVSRRDETLVLRVTREVEVDGELDPYWSRKLEMLMDLGLVA